ncbi:hypothetical protein CDAR_227001 [Caerostris darwini]|uniref:Uncharacterized protein n=1 Tax=Caerostris darwini TaxID=1538125 RepID=A0AAV4X5T0_9ARAC|nr:hypothetical protein CDAR_227001 [Caerostris darwini]
MNGSLNALWFIRVSSRSCVEKQNIRGFSTFLLLNIRTSTANDFSRRSIHPLGKPSALFLGQTTPFGGRPSGRQPSQTDTDLPLSRAWRGKGGAWEVGRTSREVLEGVLLMNGRAFCMSLRTPRVDGGCRITRLVLPYHS